MRLTFKVFPVFMCCLCLVSPRFAYAQSLKDPSAMSNAAQSKNAEPHWFRKRSRELRYPVPAQFEFAYIDRSGKVVQYGPFLLAESFNHGIAPVVVWLYELRDGKIKLDQSLSYLQVGSSLLGEDGSLIKTNVGIKPFLDPEYTVAENGGHSCVIDRNGKSRLEFDATWSGSLSEGLIPVAGDQSGPVKVEYTSLTGKVGENGVTEIESTGGTKWGYIDISGQKVIPAKFDHADAFSESRAKVTKEVPWNVRVNSVGIGEEGTVENSKIGYIDKTGTLVIPFEYQDGRRFKGGVAAVKQNGKWGYIDLAGKVVVPFKYDFAFDFADGLAAVECNQKVGYIDISDKLVIPMQYADARDFSNGLAPATKDGRLWGYIDKTGQFKIEPTYLGAQPFSKDRALVYIVPRDELGTDVSEVPFLLKLAQTARSRSQIESARAMFKRVIALAPDSRDAKVATAFLQTALPAVTVPDDAIGLYEMGCRLSAAEDKTQAQNTLEQCISKYPDFDWGYGALGQVLTMEGKFEEAEAVLKNVLTRNPNYLRGYYRLGELYRATAREQLAQQMFDKARALNPEDEIFNQN